MDGASSTGEARVRKVTVTRVVDPELEAHAGGQEGQDTETVMTQSDDKERRGSGSFKGPEESEDEEVAFRGCRRASRIELESEGYQRLESVMGPGSPEEEKLKRKLKFFFMNPVEKYHATRKIPWKLSIQILKVFIITAQLWIFAGKFKFSSSNV